MLTTTRYTGTAVASISCDDKRCRPVLLNLAAANAEQRMAELLALHRNHRAK